MTIQSLAALAIFMAGLLGVIWAGTAQATAGIANSLNYQGRLLTAGGAIVPDGTYNMEFRIYQDGTGAAAYNGGTYASPSGLDWSEDWLVGNSQGVVVKNGYFSVNLGSICSLSGGSCQGVTNAGINWNDNTLWMTMDIAGGGESTASCGTTQALFHQTWNGTNGCSADGDMAPMTRLGSAPYAQNAAELGGISASGFIPNSAAVQQTANIDYVSTAAASVGAQIQSAASGTAAVLVLKANTSSTGDLLQLQPASSTTPLARFDSGGNLYVAGTIDTQAAGGTLSVGPTNATGGISLQQNTTVASGKTFTVTAGAVSLTGASAGSAVALTVKAGADSNKGLVIYGNSATQSGDLLELYNFSGGSFVGGSGNTGALYLNGTITSGTTSAVGKLALEDGNANAYTGTLQSQNLLGSYSITLPSDGTTGTNCVQSTSGSTVTATTLQWAACSVTFANQTLSNLTSPTAINQDLTFAAANHQLTIAQAATGVGNNLTVVAGTGASGSTGGNLVLQGGANGTASGTPGSVDVKANGADSTTAFQVQEAATASNIVNVDTTAITGTGGGGSLGTWTTDSHNLPTAVGENATTAYNGFIYSLGGVNSSNTTLTTVEFASLNSNGSLASSWSTTTALPTINGASYPATTICNSCASPLTATAGGCALAYNGYIYFIDGADTAQLADSNAVLYATLNATTGAVGTWATTTGTTTMNNLGTSGGMDSSGCVIANGYIYIIGGEDGPSSSSLNEYEYAKINANGTLGTWTLNTTNQIDSSTGVINPAVVTDSTGSYIYVLGGYYVNANPINNVYSATLNASTGAVGTWAAQTHALPTAVSAANVALANGSIYIAGGMTTVAVGYDVTGANTAIATTYDATVTSGTVGTWANASDNMPGTQGWGGSVVYNGYLYAIGGSSGSTLITKVYYVQLPGSVAVTTGQGTTTIEGAYIVQNSSGAAILAVSPSSKTVSIGAGSAATDTTAKLLVLDNQASSASGDPTEVNGAMYYNAAMKAFRCGQAGNWDSCVNATPAVLADTTVTANGTYTEASGRIVFEPLYVPAQMTINDFYIHITTAFSTSAGDIGLYNSAGNLVLDGGSGSLPISVTGLETIAPVQTGTARIIAPGQYYLAWTGNSAGAVESASMPAGMYKGNGSIGSGGGSVLPASVTVSSISMGTVMPIMAVSN